MNVLTSAQLQTAKVWLHNLGDDCGGSCLPVRLVMDSESQGTNVTRCTKRALKLTSSRSEHLCIKTFEAVSKVNSDCKVARFARFGLGVN